MLISALCDYYSVLTKRGQVLPAGYSNVKIHYLVCLQPDGTIAQIMDYCKSVPVEKAKGKIRQVQQPQSLMLPQRTEKPGIDANIAEHRPVYLFGLNWERDGFSAEDKTGKAKKSHESFVNKQLAFLADLDTPLVNAYRNFVQQWEPVKEKENPYLLALGKTYVTAGFAFCLSGRPDLLLQDDPVFRAAWEASLKIPVADDTQKAQCCITGALAPIPLVHNKIKGFPGGSAMGNVLIGYKGSAMDSYGKTQSRNSNISQQSMEAYTQALNCLVADKTRRAILDDVVVLHWAVSENDLYDKVVTTGVFQGFNELQTDSMDADETNTLLQNIWTEAKQATVTGARLDVSAYLDPQVEFYMVGLKPNSARLAVEFIYRNQFGTVLQNIARHQLDMQMSAEGKPLPLWRIKKELIQPNSKNDTVDPGLLSRLLEAIFNGYRYPVGLLATVVRRVKTDTDSDTNTYVKLNPVRAGLIKGYLNRKARLSGQREEITMALNTDNQNPAYLCGRLFAILEKLQQDASNNSLNRTIKDAYFASACSTPAVVFPKLLRLAQYHMSKASAGGFWNYCIGEITGKLGGAFPRTLTLDEQGTFILGYYQQYWEKAAKNTEKTEQ